MRSRRLAVVACAFMVVAGARAQLRPGDRAPDFTLPFATTDTIVHEGLSLSDILQSGVAVLAFYPADWSGGCTKEMCTLRDNFTSLSTLDARVYGISGDYVYAHREWARHHKLQFPLMSDHDHRVARAYNSYNARTGYNRRTVYVIDRDGHIAYMDTVYSVATPDSFERLTRALTELRGGSR